MYRWDATNRLTDIGAEGCGKTGFLYHYTYDAQNRRVAKHQIHGCQEEAIVAAGGGEEAMLRDPEAKLYCALGGTGVPARGRVRSAGFRPLADAWTHGEGVNPYVGAPVRSSRFSGSRSGGVLAGGAGQSSGFSLQNDNYPTTESTEYSETVRGGAQVRSAGFSLSPSEECRGGADWLDERATEALLTRAGVLCYSPQYPVYEKQTFAYDGWRVIQEHKKMDGNGIPMATAIPVARQFTWGNYLDEALTVDADTDSDGDCLDSGGSTRYYYHQNSLFSVVALSDTSANYKEGYEYDPYGRHVRITDGNDADTYVNFGSNDSRSAGATSNYGNPYLFTGQRLDSESGLYYYKMRYYSTSQGRFLSRDPVGYGSDVNLYCYTGDSPLTRNDPMGLESVFEMDFFSVPWYVNVVVDEVDTWSQFKKEMETAQHEVGMAAAVMESCRNECAALGASLIVNGLRGCGDRSQEQANCMTRCLGEMANGKRPGKDNAKGIQYARKYCKMTREMWAPHPELGSDSWSNLGLHIQLQINCGAAIKKPCDEKWPIYDHYVAQPTYSVVAYRGTTDKYWRKFHGTQMIEPNVTGGTELWPDTEPGKIIAF